MHDSYDVDPRAVREILNLIVMLISAEFKILELKVRVKLESTAARTDALTSLFNRKAFDEELAKISERHAAGTLPDATLAMIDLDGMKAINDSRGHDEGDRLLQLFARKLCETYPRDRVYRLGGDEFALIFRGSESLPGERKTPDVRGDLERIVSEMRAEEFPEAGASGGTAKLTETAGNVDETVRLADQRMYDQKHGRLASDA
jgi:diguanylate cyclase (GGDEF)-like protein